MWMTEEDVVCSRATWSGVVCGRLRRTRGRKMNIVQWLDVITLVDHVPSSKILHR
jgi:hypothetical protein